MDVVLGLGLRAYAGMVSMLSDYVTDLLAATYCKLWLAQAGVTISPSTDIGTISWATFDGYEPQSLTSVTPVAIDATGVAYCATNLFNFTHNGGPTGNNIGAAVFMKTAAGGSTAMGTIAAGGGGVLTTPTVTAGGSGYKTAPEVAVDGAPGVNGKVTATVVGGAVTALNIVDAGSGYVAPTLTIAPPVQMEAFVNLTNPRPMNSATDSLPIVLQLSLGA